MQKGYNLYNLEPQFKNFLLAENISPISLKNYLSDFRHFSGWIELYTSSNQTSAKNYENLSEMVNEKSVEEYRSYLSENNIPLKTINRRLSTVRKFCSFCISQGWLKENPAKKVNNIGYKSGETDQNKMTQIEEVTEIKAPRSPNFIFGLFALILGLVRKLGQRIGLVKKHNEEKNSPENKSSSTLQNLPPSSNLGFQYYIGFLIILVFIATLGAGIYNQFFSNSAKTFAYPTAPVRAGRLLSFQGRLTDSLGNPITTATNVTFKLYNVSTGGTALYTAGPCSITPDQDGIFNALIGGSGYSPTPPQTVCGTEVDSTIFSENANVYLGITVASDSEMTPRQQIANVGYAINAETLQGLPPGAGMSNIPYINSDGDLLISESNPNINSTYASATFTISSANAATIQSAGSGDIILQATGSGALRFRTGGSSDTYTRLYIDSSTNGGNVGIGTTAPMEKLDVNGNATIAGNLTFYGGVRTIASRALNDLAIGDSQTGNILISPNSNKLVEFFNSSNYINSSGNLTIAGNLTVPGTTTFNGVAYTWPGTAGTNGYVLSTNGTGGLSWVAQTGGGGGSGTWIINANGSIYPINNTVDAFIGVSNTNSATTSAKFGFLNVNSGTPTASIAGSLANVATYLTGNGNLATTNMANLTLGGSTTGNVILNSRGSTALTANGTDLTAGGTFTLPNSNTLTGVSGYAQFSNGVSVGNGTTYYLDSTGNLNASTVKTGGTQRIDASGNLTNIGTTQLNGITYTWPGAQTGGYSLTTNGSGGLSWTNPQTFGLWTTSGGALYPINNTLDAFIGTSNPASATTSSKFAFLNVNSGTPTASIAGSLANVATYLTGNGNLGTTNMQPFTIGGTTTGPIQLSPNGTTGLYLDNGGNVGVGTTNPTALLDIAGNASTSGSLSFRGSSPANVNILNGDNFNVQTSVGGNTGLNPVFTILNGGNVGINTTTPTTKLQINQSSSGISDILKLSANKSDAIGTGNAITFYGSVGDGINTYTSGKIYSVFDNNGYQYGRLTLASYNTLGTALDTLSLKNDQVGIGTTSPSQKLTVKINSVGDVAGFYDGANNQDVLIGDGGVTTLKPSAFDKVFYYNGTSYTDDTTEAATNAGTPFTIFQVANPSVDILYLGLDHPFATINVNLATVGVGVTLVREYWNGSWTSFTSTDNTSSLTQSGTITFTAPSDWTTTTVNGVTKYWVRLRSSTQVTTAPTGYFVTPTTGSRFYVYAQSGDANAALYVGDTGNVGIGTNNPQAKLDIAGATSSITNTAGDITISAASGNINFNSNNLTNFLQALGSTGTVTAPTYSYSSSANTGMYLATTNVLRFTTNGTDRLTIDSLGNVGIGTTTPAYKLDVAGTVGAQYYLDKDNPNYGLDPAGTTNFGGYSFKITGGALMAYDSGLVGIGNQTPVGKLDVQGAVPGKALTILNETGDQALLTASASGVTKFTVNHDGSITLSGISSNPTTEQGIAVVPGTVYYNNTTTTNNVTTGDLWLYGQDSAFHRIALDMTMYTSTSANIANGGYININHTQTTNDLSIVGWVYDTITNTWKNIQSWANTIVNNLNNQFNPSYTQKNKVTTVTLQYQNNSVGTGADGAITVSVTTNMNATSLISGRSCADGGDMVNYNITTLTSTTATLTSSPSAGCLAVGDEILIINLQGTSTAYSNVGKWETLIVQSVSSNVVTFTTPKQNYYGNNANDDSNLGTVTGTQRVMLQRVPNYTNVTINSGVSMVPTAYNGSKGGVIFFRANGAVNVNGNINSSGYGYRGGAGTVSSSSYQGESTSFENTGTATTANPEGGGGGGGGGGNCSGGGGAGYGTAGTAGLRSGTSCGTVGAAGPAYPSGGNNSLTKLYMGSAGGGGDIGYDGTNWNQSGGTGGRGGGIIYVAASTLTVSGTVQSNGANGGAGSAGSSTAIPSGGGGGGAGGSVKIVGGTLTLGASKVTASGGTGGQNSACSRGDTWCNYNTVSYGGNGGVGIITIGSTSSISGNSNPSYNTISFSYNSYAIYISKEINTPNTASFNNISWTQNLPSGTTIQMQTRSGATANSTDGTWEAWKPTTSQLLLDNANTPSNWVGTNDTVAAGDVARYVSYFEDENEPNANNLIKTTATAANGYAERTISSTDISSYQYISLWLRSAAPGQVVTLGFGLTAGNEQTKTVTIDAANTWQKVYWDISNIAAGSRNAVTKLRITNVTNGNIVYFDNIKAESDLATNTGSTITSTANNYIQYRAILSTTNTLNSPTLSQVKINLTNTAGTTYTIDADSIIDPNASVQNQTARPTVPTTLPYSMYSTGTGADGAITVTVNTSINGTNLISGRTCVDGGDAVNYNVTSLTSTTATLVSIPSAGCLAANDEVLLINLQGTSSAYGNVGKWETLIVQSVSSNVVTFTTPKQNYYGNNANDDSNLGTVTGTQRVMLQRVPNYTNVTINSGVSMVPTAYNGSKGGVIFFRANGAVNVNGNINSSGYGYRGGAGTVSSSSYQGESTSFENTGTATTANPEGGGGGGGGGGNCSGGGGAGYGTAGTAGLRSGTSCGTVGAAGPAYPSGGNNSLTKLYMGSAGGGGDIGYDGTNWNQSGGTGGRGGGIIYVAASTLTVSGTVQSNGANGGAGSAGSSTAIPSGGGGGGAGGSVKIVGGTLTLGASKVTASGGTGGQNSACSRGDTWCNYNTVSYGGNGGVGIIAAYDTATISGSTSPAYSVDSSTGNYNPYNVYISKEIATTGATAFSTIAWAQNLPTGTMVQLQTRSGNTTNSTDGTWEAWKPTTSQLVLDDANTYTNWVGTNATVTDGQLTRNVNYYEDEDVTGAPNVNTKITTTAANGYAERTIAATNISSYQYISAWVSSAVAGNVITLSFGQTTGNEQQQSFTINNANTWQKIYWDISDIAAGSRSSVTKIRFTSSVAGNSFYIDSIVAENDLSNNAGATITSTANNYIMYRAILTTTSPSVTPTFSNVTITYTTASGTQTVTDKLSNQNGFDVYDPSARLIINSINLDNYKSVNVNKLETGVSLSSAINTGNGADGDVEISVSTVVDTTNRIAGRYCADGGDAVNYNIVAMTSQTATLSVTPSSSCLAIGDEVLIINLQGTATAHSNVGNWETLRIQNINQNVITFTTAKTKYYGNNPTDDTNLGTTDGTQRVMLQRVPNYHNLTLDSGVSFYASAYNGAKGGVMFFRASGAVNIDGSIGQGASGYPGGVQGYYGGYQGASTTLEGTTNTYTVNPEGGGGGGQPNGAPQGCSGGGGGAYGTNGAAGTRSGSNCGTPGYAGTYYPTGGNSTLNKLYFGSGGGGGSYGYNGGWNQTGGNGGTGGGIVYISANIITVSGYIGSDGGGGGAGSGGSSTAIPSGGGGGGAGGSILLQGNTVNLGTNSNVHANGGSGGTNGAQSTYAGGWSDLGGYAWGGNGGTGIIAVNYGSTISGNTSPTYNVGTITPSSNNYSVFVSDEIATPNAAEYHDISWLANQTPYGLVELQTRSGPSNNSTDGSWEQWLPATSSASLVTLDNANTPSNWTPTNAAVYSGSTSLSTPNGVWNKYNNVAGANSDTTGVNGQIPLGATAGRGDTVNIEKPSVIKDGSTYKMWYSGPDGSNWRIYYATSTDGVTWTKYDNTKPANSDTTGTNGRIPLGATAGRGDVNGVHSPAVIKDGSTYKMWYSGMDASSVWRVYYATSPDGLTWTKYDNTIPANSDTTGTNGKIPLGATAGRGDVNNILYSSVIKDGSTYKMWYSGGDGTYRRVFYATSPDGLTWTKLDNTIPPASNSTTTNGRLALGTNGYGDDTHVVASAVFKDGSTYEMFYSGHDGSNWRIYQATSPDGLTWTKVNNVTPSNSNTSSAFGQIPLGTATGVGDQTHALFPAVIDDNGTYKAWYGGHDGTNERIYYAVMSNNTTPSDPTRNVNYYEDEDESNANNFTLVQPTQNGGYVGNIMGATDLSNYDYITLWLMSAESGNTVKVGFGETVPTEHEQTFNITAPNTWQKVYWDISKIPPNERDGVKYLRITNMGDSANYFYFDNIVANRFLTNSTGATIASTPNNYIQYRVILTSDNAGYTPTLYNVQINWNNGFKIQQIDSQNVRLYNLTGQTQQLKLDAVVFGADLAEYYAVNDQNIGAADVVAMTGQLDAYGVPILRKSNSANDPQIAGIISTQAGQTLGIQADDRRLLALAGRVPVKIASDSPSIQPGDMLTSSDIPGEAMKARPGDRTVAKSLDSWSPGQNRDSVLALVDNSIALPSPSDLTSAVVQKVATVSGATYQVIDATGQQLNNAAAYSTAVIGNLKAGAVNTMDLVAENINASQKIVSPVVETGNITATGTAKLNEIQTNTIHPQNGDITIDLNHSSSDASPTAQLSPTAPTSSDSGQLAKLIIKGFEGKTVTTIDASGDASFAGQVVAQSLSINNDATISGTLNANNIASNNLNSNTASISGTLIAGNVQSNNINQLENQVASASSTLADQNSNLQNLSSNINDIQKLIADIRNQPSPNAADYQNLTTSTNLANLTNSTTSTNTGTGLMNQTPTLDQLTVTGNSNLYNLSVSNSILTGSTMIENNSVISLASELKLSALDKINFFDGGVTIARDGTITTQGQLIAQGGVSTNVIKPINSDTLDLAGNLNIIGNLQVPKYLDATSSAQVISAPDNFSVNGIFAPAIDTATTSAGIAFIPPNSNEIIIYNNNVKKDSLIYITPTSPAVGLPQAGLTVSDKQFNVDKPYFKVVTNSPSTSAIKFNWLIIN
ncbi:site-specific integrase [Patescibacteria group bacterium]|nr:site-specific integrase [Patescibacteria group bacterium]